jgi:glycerol-3-phosphate acyltransferase PlsY
MSTMPLFIAMIVIAYLLGSINTAIIVCRIGGYPDPRTEGSGNPGATNVKRVAGTKAAAITLFGDAFKGFLAVCLAWAVGIPAHLIGWVGFAAFIGHLLPIFFKFQGGKGVATAFGVMLALSWQLTGCIALIWLVCQRIFKLVSVSSIVAAVFTPLIATWLKLDVYLAPLCVISLLLILRHHDNIRRLLKGTET